MRRERRAGSSGDFFFSTMPVKDLIRGMGEAVPAEVRRIAEGLVYRDFITVGLLVKELRIKEGDSKRISDNWIYVQEPDVKLGRIQIFNNWSPYMVEDQDKTCLGLEYFCTEGDELWRMSDEDFADFAIRELASIGFIDRESVLDHCVVRVQKTYPAYFGSYDQFSTVRRFLDGFENLFLIGRNGMHRYNNQDHSMLTAMTAVDNIVAGVTDKDNIWQVNTELGYHEETEGMQPATPLTSIENLTQAYRVESDAALDFQYKADVYWQRTEISYPHYPTVKHRLRFILNTIRSSGVDRSSRIFDYGCGEGQRPWRHPGGVRGGSGESGGLRRLGAGDRGGSNQDAMSEPPGGRSPEHGESATTSSSAARSSSTPGATRSCSSGSRSTSPRAVCWCSRHSPERSTRRTSSPATPSTSTSGSSAR